MSAERTAAQVGRAAEEGLQDTRQAVGSSTAQTIQYLHVDHSSNFQQFFYHHDIMILLTRYWRLKIEALAESSNWIELEKFSKSKKSPIGYEVSFVNSSVHCARLYGPTRVYISVESALWMLFDAHACGDTVTAAGGSLCEVRQHHRSRQIPAESCTQP